MFLEYPAKWLGCSTNETISAIIIVCALDTINNSALNIRTQLKGGGSTRNVGLLKKKKERKKKKEKKKKKRKEKKKEKKKEKEK